MKYSTGLILESFHFKDFDHSKIFGSAPADMQITPLDRDTSGIPVVFQGNVNTCVACSITWLKQWLLKAYSQSDERLSWPFLAEIAHIGPKGAAPSQVLEPARKTGICKWDTFNDQDITDAIKEAWNYQIPCYSFVTDYSVQGIYNALMKDPILIGVLNWKGMGDHMMVAYDVTADGSALKAKSWWDKDHQTEEIVQFDQVEVAVSFTPFFRKPGIEIHPLEVFWDKIRSLFLYNV